MSTGTEAQTRSKYARLFAELAAKFGKNEEKILEVPKKPRLTYVTARTVMNRFDAILGPENWWDEYLPLMGDSILCRLTIRLPDGETITKQDAGGAAGMKDAGDDDKSMVSDAFKRAAVKFGVGRYLYQDGVAEFVRDELTAKKEERQARAQGEQAEPEPEPQPPAVEPPPTSTRSQVNEAFKPAGQAEAQRPANDREPVKFGGDRIGARGLDVRPWSALVEKEVEAANRKLLGFLVEHDLDAQEATTSARATNHMVTWAEENGEPAPTVRGAKGNQVRAPLGKLGAHLHGLYQAEGWRVPMRAELKKYLKAKLDEAMQVAENQAFGDPPMVEAEPDQAEPEDGQLVGANAEDGAWEPGRE